MSVRKIKLARIQTTKGEKHFIDVYISYNKGGLSMMNYKMQPRGYDVHVQPIEVSDGFTTFMGFSGVRQHIEGAKRFSQKRLAELAQAYKGSDTVQNMIDLVCAKQKTSTVELAK
jgi:hypothetical protein